MFHIIPQEKKKHTGVVYAVQTHLCWNLPYRVASAPGLPLDCMVRLGERMRQCCCSSLAPEAERAQKVESRPAAYQNLWMENMHREMSSGTHTQRSMWARQYPTYLANELIQVIKISLDWKSVCFDLTVSLVKTFPQGSQVCFGGWQTSWHTRVQIMIRFLMIHDLFSRTGPGAWPGYVIWEGFTEQGKKVTLSLLLMGVTLRLSATEFPTSTTGVLNLVSMAAP